MADDRVSWQEVLDLLGIDGPALSDLIDAGAIKAESRVLRRIPGGYWCATEFTQDAIEAYLTREDEHETA